MMTDQVEEIEEDDYDRLLRDIGRSEELDQRIATHEAGHILVNRIAGSCSISEVTINPGDGFEGLCRGSRSEAFVSNGVPVGRIDAATIRQVLAPLMPKAGESRDDKSDVYANVLDACTELMAGAAAEKLLLGEASFAFDDRRQATELAALICKTPIAVERFLEFCTQQATDMLSENFACLLSLGIVLKIRRTMTGEEIDRAIATMLAHQAAAIEQFRRKRWQFAVENAERFKAECAASRKREQLRAAQRTEN